MWNAYAGELLYLDSNIVIFAIEAGNPWTTVLRGRFEAVDRGEVRVCMSEVTLAEVLAKPLALGEDGLVEQFEAFLDPSSPVMTIPVSRSILREAARIHAAIRTKLVDSIHVATALDAGCRSFVTNDESLGRRLEQPRWLPLSAIKQST